MREITDADWAELQALAGLAGGGEERVAVARARFANGADRAGGPLTLLVGRPDGGIDLLFDKWLGRAGVAALRDARGRPLVVGAADLAVKPRQGAWPALRHGQLDGYSIVAVRSTTLAADVATQLAGVGPFEHVVFVTRWTQPLPTPERELLRPLASLAGTARVLVVTLPGESPTADDAAAVKQFVRQVLRDGGFDGRVADVGVWLTAGTAPETVDQLEPFFAPRPDEVAGGRAAARRAAFAELLRELAANAPSADRRPVLPIDPEELGKIEPDFARYLTVLGETVGRRFATAADGTAERVQAAVMEEMARWRCWGGTAGTWLKYLDAVRPGAAIGLQTAAEEAVGTIGFDPPPTAPPAWQPTAAWADPVVKRLALGLTAGAAAYGLLFAFLPAGLPGHDILASVGMMAGAIGGYTFAPRVTGRGPKAETATHRLPHGQVTNWPAFQHALEGWLRGHLAGSAAGLTERCRKLATRLDLPAADGRPPDAPRRTA